MVPTVHDGAGTIRSASLVDARALASLFASVRLDVMPLGAADLAACLDRGPLIVLDVGADMLGAAAHVAFVATDDEVHARVEFFVIHPGLADIGVDDRMVAAVLAICEASGCVDFDLAPARGQPERRSSRSR